MTITVIQNPAMLELHLRQMWPQANFTPVNPPVSQLASVGFSADKSGLSGLKYVLLAVFNKDKSKVVGLMKLKGPQFLRNKITFPGGQIEAGESLERTCAREMKEETGLDIPEDQWHFVARSETVALFSATADNVHEARTMELEPVFTLDSKGILEYAQSIRAGTFAPDFAAILSHFIAQ